ncbi:DMT family transporter [Streptosporangium algeriense]|uniref:DMT family transporter n=1 Tax=Streptosporangium algeriense TaxID=1682748 RepID=A0ABW3DP33_9ACTN
MAAVSAPRPLMGAVLLLFVSAAWGSAFPLMKDLMARMPVVDLLTERYAVAAVALLALRPRCLRGLSENTWLTGLLLGLLFGAGQTAQAIALHDLPSSVSGFTVGSYVVITPVLGLILLGAEVSFRTWTAVALATAAMTVFTLLRGAEGGSVPLLALAVTLLSAVLYAAHTLVLGDFEGAGRDAYALAVIQLGVIAIMTGVLAVPDVASLPGTVADPDVYAARPRLCDLGHLRTPYLKADGEVGYRCPAEPVGTYVRKNRPESDTIGRKCLCNGLVSAIGLGQRRSDGYAEPALLTLGQDLAFLRDLPGDHTAADVIGHLLHESG